MAKKPNQAAASSGYWENLRRQRRREIEERAQIAQEGMKNLGLGRLSGFLGLGPDIAEVTTPPLVTPSASLKYKGQKPPTPELTEPKDQFAYRLERAFPSDPNLKYKYTSADLGRRMGISPAEQIAGDVVGPGAPVTALSKGAAAAVKGFNLADLGAAASAVATGIFAGKRARNLPKLSYDRALEMEKAGDGKYRIYEETGFWKGPEGDWRFEIDDTDIKFKPEALKSFEEIMEQELLVGAPGQVEELQRVRYAMITDVVDHPQLFEAYPELEEYYIKVDPNPIGRRGYQTRQEMVPMSNGEMQSRPVIMIQAPTRESEISRLESLVEGKKRYLSDKMDELAMLEGRTDRNVKFGEGDVDKKLQKLIIDEEKAIAGIETQLQSLRDGAQPDIPFTTRSILTHELQHAVQDLENLPRGGNVSAAEMQTETAIKQLAEQTGKTLTEVKQAVAERNYTLAKVAALDKILYLQFLQRFKNSDNPTRSARLINNSSLNYEITLGERDWLGPPPSRRNIPKYGAYLRRKAELYQAKVIDDILKREESGQGHYNAFQDALNSVLKYEDKRGKVDVSQLSVRNYDPRFIGNAKFYEGRQISLENNQRLANPDEIIQPNWMAIPENVLKNAIKRLGKEADQYLGEQKVFNKVEDATKRLENLRRDNPFDYSTELYYRLAGEAEARAVQSRFETSTALSNLTKEFDIYEADNGLFKIRSGTNDLTPTEFKSREEAQKYLEKELGFEDRIPTAMQDYGGAYDRNLEDLAFYYPRGQVPRIEAAAAVNVPKSDVGFTSPALRVIMESNREQLPKEQWLKFLKGNGVKDDELEFSGLGEWLKQQKGQVSRADLEEYMTTQNQLKIEEVVYGGEEPDYDEMIDDYVRNEIDQYTIYQMGDAPDQFADELAEGANPKDFVIDDPNGEVIYNRGGDLRTFGDRSGARSDLEYLLEQDAKQMPESELMERLGITDESKDFFGPVKYGGEDLSLPGQRDKYRELVLYWDKPGQPSMPKGFSVKEVPTGSGKFTIVDEDGSIVDRTSYDTEAEAIEAFNKFFEIEKGTESLWMGSHQYTDKPNPLLHIRFSERRDSAGERILVIEEIQSDIAKRGQKEGFRPKGFEATNEKIKQLEAEKAANTQIFLDFQDMSANEREQAGMTQDAYDALVARDSKIDELIEAEQLAMIELPPGTEITKTKRPLNPEMFEVRTPKNILDRTFHGMTKEQAINNAKYFIKEVQDRALDRGPFIMDTKDYMELGLKRMILWASENGFEKIAWTTGEQQMKRYNQLVEGIEILTVAKKKDGSEQYRIMGQGVGEENMDSGDISRSQLDEYVGERLATKIEDDFNLTDPEVDLAPGGEAYDIITVPVDDLKLPKDPRHFLMIAYDKVLKNAAQKLGKKYDAKVNQEPLGLPGLGVTKDKVWTMNLSEKLKSAAEKGLPYMAVVPPAAMMMNQEQDRTPINRAAARPIMENYAN